MSPVLFMKSALKNSNAPIFIVGCPRSGTTLLRDLLRSHPNLTFPDESQFIARFYRAYDDPASDDQAWKLARRILQTAVVSTWGIRLEARDFVGCRSFSEVTRRLFEAWARREGKPRWGDKTPHYVREIPLLRQLFPEAQIIHIVRDGRDVALSWLETRYEPMNMYKAARLWAEMVRRGRSDGSRLPASDYYEVRYETLLGEPEKTMRQVCEFLREPFDPAVLAPNRLKPGLRGARFDRDLVTQNTRIWQSSMSLRQRVLFESVAGDLLGELGYAVENGGTKLSATQRAWHETDHQLRHLALGLWNLRTPESRKKARTYGWAEMRRLLGGSRHRQRNRKIRRLNIRHYDSDAPPA